MPFVNFSASDAIDTAMSNPLGPNCDGSSAPAEVRLETVLNQLDSYRANPKHGFDALIGQLDLCENPLIAAALTECATANGRYDVAELALRLAYDPAGILAAQLQLMQNNPRAALDALVARPADPRHLARSFGLRIRAHTILGEYENAVLAAEDWAAETPNSPVPYKVLARLLADQNDVRAQTWYDRAIEVSGGNTGLILDMAKFLIKIGKPAIARNRLGKIIRTTGDEARRRSNMMSKLCAS